MGGNYIRRRSAHNSSETITTEDGRVVVIEYTGSLPKPEPVDAERDWLAWKECFNARGPGGVARSRSFPEPSEQTLNAVSEVLNRGAAEREGDIDGARLHQAASITTRYSRIEILGVRIHPARHDYLLDALNRYPHGESTACRWLIPALRNFVRKPRETPDELLADWRLELDRLRDLTLHPHSPRFVGRPPGPLVLDWEDSSHAPTSRRALDRWRISAHVSEVPNTAMDEGVSLKLSASRLNILNRLVCEILGKAEAYTSDVEPEFAHYTRFLLEASADPSRSSSQRSRFRDCLELLHEAIRRGLLKRYPLRLYQHHVEAYEQHLAVLRQIKKKRSFGDLLPSERQAALDYAPALGLEHDAQLHQWLRAGRMKPREAAAHVLAAEFELEISHPQTIFEALAEARKARDAVATIHGKPPSKRRGRPPKKQNI